MLFVLYRTEELVLLLFIAVLIAVYLDALVGVLGRRAPVPRVIKLLLAMVATLAVLAGIGALLAAPVAQQTRELIAAVPGYLAAVDAAIGRLVEGSPVLRGSGLASGERGLVTATLEDLAEFIRKGAIPYVTVTGRIVIDGIAVAVIALYLSFQPSLYTDGLVSLVPPKHREAARAILTDLGASLRAWVEAQIAAMVILAVLTAIGLWLLDVPYWLAFGLFAGILVLIPFFGTLVSTLLPALLVLGERGFLAFLAVAAVGVVVHVVEANFAVPVIMHRHVRLPPVLTMLSVLAMAKLAGPLGLLVAVPTLIVVMVLVRHVLLKRVYGEGQQVAGSREPMADSR